MHGEETTARVIAASAVLFGGTDLRAADAGVFEVLSGEMPTTALPPGALDAGLPLVDALVTLRAWPPPRATPGAASRARASPSTARRPTTSSGRSTKADLLAGGFVMLQKGKKNYGLLKVGI